jgi:hypothetical protein
VGDDFLYYLFDNHLLLDLDFFLHDDFSLDGDFLLNYDLFLYNDLLFNKDYLLNYDFFLNNDLLFNKDLLNNLHKHYNGNLHEYILFPDDDNFLLDLHWHLYDDFLPTSVFLFALV